MVTLSVLMPAGGAIHHDSWRALAFDWVQRRYHQLLPHAELVIGHNTDDPYNRAAARNDAFARATGEVLIVADADTVFHLGQIITGLQLLEQGAPWVIPHGYERYYNLTAATTQQVLAYRPSAAISEPSHPSMFEQRVTSWGGLLMVPRSAWELVGGYDERFRYWGGEDNAFAAALDRLVGHHVRTDDDVLHLWHPRGDADFDNPGWPANEALLGRYQAAATADEMTGVRCEVSP